MGYSGARFAPDFLDKIEDLPGYEYLEQGEIKKALEGKPFCVLGDNGENEHLPGIETARIWQYYQLWEDFHCLNVLPHGRGTLDEERWVLDVIKAGVKAWRSTENWRLTNPVRAGIDK